MGIARLGPDLTKGISITDLGDGQTLLGHVGQEHALLARAAMSIMRKQVPNRVDPRRWEPIPSVGI
jgi:hypothetical protein